MHELGIVFYVIRDLKDIAEEKKIDKIKKVTLEIGEVSSIVPDLFMDCWKWAIKDEELLKDSDLEVDIIEAINHCDECGMDYKATRYGRKCPNCKSEHTHLVCGNESNIKSFEY